MSAQVQDADVGRMVREHREAEEQLVKIGNELRNIGREIGLLASAIVANPGGLGLGDGVLHMNLDRVRQSISKDLLDAERICNLSKNYREAMQKRNKLASEFERLGFGISVRKTRGTY